ncbi:gamma-butyrobetaine dioxygenase [Aureococcus anophagefferens]|nr:gamma-butyrobetaine dioxygenase [Aureococcus anophagefferens]
MRCWVALALAAAVKAAADSRDVELLGDGSIAVPTLGVLHAEWLRERCKHVTSVDPITRQRLLNPHEYAPPVVTNATLAGAAGAEVLRVSFRDGHESEFSVPLLRTMMGASVAAEASDAYVADERRRLYGVLQSAGVAVVRGAPTEEGVCSALASDLSTLRTTEWGEQFNVRSEPDLLQASGAKFDLAYTAKAIGQHTDNPYRYPSRGPASRGAVFCPETFFFRRTPDFQLLHAIEQCSCEQDHGVPAPCDGCTVMNYFADGFAVAERMATETPELFDSPRAGLPRRQVPPGRALLGQVGRLRRPLSRHAYAAKRRFSQLIHEPAMTIRMQLRRGDVVIFDNKRLLHSRSAIAPATAPGSSRAATSTATHRVQVGAARAAATFTDLETAPKADYERMGERYGAIDGYYYYHHFGADKHARDRLWSDESADAWRLTGAGARLRPAAFDPSHRRCPSTPGAVARVLSRAHWWDLTTRSARP